MQDKNLFRFTVKFAVLVSLLCANAFSQNEILRSGPMLGYSEMTETVVWLQTRIPAKAQIKYWKQGDTKSVKLSKFIQTNEENDHIARFTISNLEFGIRYEYEVYLNAQKLTFDYSLQFQTQPHWRWRTDPPDFKIALGSCVYINDSLFDRPGKPYGSGFEIFSTITRQKPDLMLWMGDNIYYREPDWLTESAMRYRNAQNRELPELQQLYASTHNYAIWDDHDFGPNDSDRSFRGKDWSFKIFKDYWANNSYGHNDTKGVFGRFEWGDIEFFMLDDRFHRSPNNTPISPEKVMFGEQQMSWLRDSLTSSKATFKIIVGGNQLINPLSPYESWAAFPVEQKKFFDFIRDFKIDGVVFLSGDRHYAELLKRDDLTAYPLYEFTSSSLTAGSSNPAKEETDSIYRVPNTLVTDVKNFGIIEVSGKPKDRKLTLKTIDLAGKELWKHEISENLLRNLKK